jgi:hypothetical protein
MMVRRIKADVERTLLPKKHIKVNHYRLTFYAMTVMLRCCELRSHL